MNESYDSQARLDRHRHALLRHCVQVLQSVDAQLQLAYPAERLACSERQEWCLARLDEFALRPAVNLFQPRLLGDGQPTILDAVEQTRSLVRALTETLSDQTKILPMD